ncbi:MAG TPA: hypothetical protein VEK08_21695, partial [Planctomycetota bacterium]|nr:hypothetical protein [Planctomycetota bacterium]
PTLDDDRSWALLLEELTLLKVGCVRFLLPPDGFITKRGTMDFDCDHFERLERLNAWAGANGASIVLDTMYVPRHMQVKGEESSSGWAVDNRAAANPRQFAENFAGPLLDYCLSERGWTQIRYYSPVNQPLYGDIYSHPRMDPYRAFAELLTALRQELLARDLVPQRLSMLGPGSPGVQDWPIPDFHSRGLDLDPLLDAYDQHEYFARFDGTAPNANGLSVPMTELIEHHLAPHVAYARTKGKPFLITELGHFYYGASNGDPNGPATHEAFMLDAEFALRAINTGVSGLMRWSFLNPGDINGRWQLLDTADGSLRRESHSFYGYATLVRYARPHSDVLQVQTESSFHPWPHVYACALRKMPQGDVTLLVSNNHDNEQVEVTIKLPPLFRSKKINIIRTDRILKHHKAAEIRRDPRGGPIVDKIPPRSLNVYTSLEHDALERP